MPYSISVLTKSADVEALQPQIDMLANRSLERNFFFESWVLSAALDTLVAKNMVIAVVSHEQYGVTGVFPFRLWKTFRRLPIRVLRSWRHLYCFLCTPLVCESHADETIAALLKWVRSGDAPAKVIELELISGDGPFWSAFVKKLNATKEWKWYAKSRERAVFKNEPNFQDAVSNKHLKALRRQERKLFATGTCSYRVLSDSEPVEPWIENFLRLEASGWKGRQHSALASDDASKSFFRRIVTEAKKRGCLEMLSLEIDGVPIAMKCNFSAGSDGYVFKISFDERYAKYSPGVLLELFNMQHLLENRKDIERLDSCAIPENVMFNRLWVHRRVLMHCILAADGVTAFLIRHWPKYLRVRTLVSKRILRRSWAIG